MSFCIGIKQTRQPGAKMNLTREAKFKRFDEIAKEIQELEDFERRTVERANLMYAICNGITIAERRKNPEEKPRAAFKRI